MKTSHAFQFILLTGLGLVSDAFDADAQSCVAPPSGLVGWWAGEGNATDSIGINNGTVSGGVNYVSGVVGLAFDFDGSSGDVVVPASPDLAFNSLTVETWIMPADLGNPQPIVEYGNATGLCSMNLWHGMGPGITSLPGSLSGFLRNPDNSAGIGVQSSGGLFQSNQWSHVALTYDAATYIARLYHNGVLVDSSTSSVPVQPDGLRNVNLGYRPVGSADLFGGRRFLGKMDEVSIYNRALSDTEIQAIFAAGNAGKCLTPTAPFIFAQPANQAVSAGSNAFFAVGAGGTQPLSYQWSFNGSPLPGATNANLYLPNVNASQAGNYAVTITNLLGLTNSSSAALSVLVFPAVLSLEPTNQMAVRGDTAIFVAQATGTPPLAYQWFFNNSVLVGATGSILTLPNVTTNQAGPYSVTVTNAYGSDSSSNALLAVVVLGTNLVDDFDPGIDAAEWSSFGGTVLATNYGGFTSSPNSLWFGGAGSRFAITRSLDATPGGYVRFQLRLASGGIPPTWETVDLPAEGVVLEYTLNGGGTWTEFGRYNTTTFFSWTPLSVPIPLGARTSGVRFRWRQLSNSGASNDHWALDDVAIMTVATAPVITVQPQGQSVIAGGTASFSATVSGSQPFSYQWRFNGTNLLGATNFSLTRSNVQPSSSGLYSLVVGNAAGAATSSNALLKVNVVSAFADDQPLTNSVFFFAGTTMIELQNAFPGGLIFYTLDGSPPSFASSQYAAPFAVTQNASLRAIGYRADFFESGELEPISLFLAPAYPLHLATDGGGGVTANPARTLFASNSTVTLTATPSAGWTFLKWMGDANGTNSATTLVMTHPKTVKAIFGTILNTTAAGGGSVVLNPAGGLYPFGTIIQLSAIPNTDSQFALWGNAASGNVNPLSFTLTNANPTVSSLFAPVSGGQSALTVVPLGRGTVTVNPQANVYPTGASVTIAAAPDSGQSFLGWGGDAAGNQNPLLITVASNRTIFANFTQRPGLSISAPPGLLSSEGPRLTVTGNPGEGYQLDSSTNLTHWLFLANVTNTYGSGQFTDPTATNTPNIFYRAKRLD